MRCAKAGSGRRSFDQTVTADALLFLHVIFPSLVEAGNQILDGGLIAGPTNGHELLVESFLVIGILRQGEPGLFDGKGRLLCPEVELS